MGNVFIDESILADIAEAIRSKTGKTELLLPSEMSSEIESITTSSSGDSSGSDSGSSGSSGSSGDSSGGSSSSGSGSSGDSSSGSTGELIIADGFTINFYDVDNVMIESHSAKFGFMIDAPLSYTADSWQNENGVLYNFPLTVTSDMGAVATNLFATRASRCEDELYEYFNVNKGEYPFLFGTVYASSTYKSYAIYFTKVLPAYANEAIINMPDAKFATVRYGNLSEYGANEFSNVIIQKTTELGDYTSSVISINSLTIFANFEFVNLTERLDETIFTALTLT